MNFRILEAFHTVMISGSTVRAAELLQVTQPAISRSIADLEASLGFALFDRVRGRLVPTPEGQMFFREVNESYKGLDRLRSAAASIREYGSGIVRIGTLSALAATLVPRAVQGFRIQHPKIRITLQVAGSATIRNLIADGQLDLGLAADEIDRAGVDAQMFASFPGVIAMAPDHPLTRKTGVGPTDLADVPLIGLTPEDRARHRFDQAMADAGVAPSYIVETANSSTVCALAMSGDAVGLVNPLATGGFTERGLILRPFAPKISFRSYLLFRPDSQRARLVREFSEHLFHARNSVIVPH
ncbi:LysR substrate-binding domain-containing protein [Falsirhodobacter sp. 20TX0035]|uniref:LysR substrate-binding domain-containing protein n=1 Tax=Falsirhodobacter sp. 20TX0035 TaxID=3022019 RepID=UPI00232CCE9B|nr:LysR substrate-binding domain-containing protein [Falsirhodobacter sp. 20TX0035]MDB6454227.1 LysR substrate-binding domain-containing protein [Falsirhodobacter sp. 20TX0035]